MKICELKLNNREDRAGIIPILVFAGYKVSIEERRANDWTLQKDYYVIVEKQEETK